MVRGEIKNCTPLWREARFEVKMLKNCGSQSTFSSSDVEKLQVSKSLWREAHFQVKMRKTRRFGPLFEVPMLKNCTSKSKC